MKYPHKDRNTNVCVCAILPEGHTAREKIPLTGPHTSFLFLMNPIVPSVAQTEKKLKTAVI